ncbi:GNAT family N-acetyltransferase [Kineococcus rhizosphaerae]|uniref:Ribosomal protein S18 acetylase RimI-like enzyme n=1 Tax=Kineococcus rhizosphaerae TaxID=559628 RepID=A0A2T0QZ55_9ACTN|nr:GNAT family N-acetyltransferase [Kineococcus rhizosphaerae]PRY11801.1 ribosomal protein S18 acetylase RimI-like enzyme [Kineococcus rhizosphaerae]
MTDLTFRAAHAADVPAVVTLVESAYRGDASRAGWTTEADLLEGQRTDAEGISAVVEGADAVLLLAERDGAHGAELLGCCELRRVGEAAYFGTFAVDPAAQGGGIGRRLLTHADAEAVRRWGAPYLEMTVIAQRADLIAWYERLGFARTGDRRPFPYGDERFGRPLRDDLEFVVLRRPTSSRPGA